MFLQRIGIVILGLSLIWAAGCTKKAEIEEDRIVITYANPLGVEGEKLNRQIVDDFNASQNKVYVRLRMEPWAGFQEKMIAGLTSGTAPEVWFTDGVQILEWAAKNAIEDLTPFITRDINLKDYIGFEGLRDPEGRYWGVPYGIQTAALFYNKKLFDEAKVPYPDESLTWEKLVEIGKKLTRDINGDGKPDIYGYSGNYYNFIYQNGGRLLDASKRNSRINTPPVIEAMQFYYDLVHKYKISPPPDFWTSFGNSSVKVFGMGRLAMVQTIYYFVHIIRTRYPEIDFEVTYPPRKVSRACYYDPNALVITAGLPEVKKEAAWEFIKFFLSYRSQRRIAEGMGELPASRKAMEDFLAEYKGKPANLRVFLEMFPQSVDMDVSPAQSRWMLAFQDEISLMIMGKKTPAQACESAHIKVQKILDEAYAR